MAEIAEKAFAIPGRVRLEELEVLVEWAKQVPVGKWIVEIGSLYGRSAIALAMASQAMVVAIDNFSDRHEAHRQPSILQLQTNLRESGVHNVLIWDIDSTEAGKVWQKSIDLLFVDGGHKYEQAKSDMQLFGPWAKSTIIVHDYGYITSVKTAVDEWLAEHTEWTMHSTPETLAVLRRKPC